jgi:hypothetical protein
VVTAVAANLIRDNKLIRELISMHLDTDHFVIFGSAPLLAYGLRTKVRDLDVVARGKVMRWAQDAGVLGVGTHSGDPVWQLKDGHIQFSAGWITNGWDTDDLIDNADVIDGLRFARLPDVLQYKKELHRPKDLADIYAIQAYLAKTAGEPGAGDRPPRQ